MNISIDEGNELLCEFMGFKVHINSFKEEEFYNEAYPELPYFRKGYEVPLNFGFKYQHSKIIDILYNNPENFIIVTERICIAKMKFHFDWNWLMEGLKHIKV